MVKKILISQMNHKDCSSYKAKEVQRVKHTENRGGGGDPYKSQWNYRKL